MENQFRKLRGFSAPLTNMGSGSTQAYCHQAPHIIQPAQSLQGTSSTSMPRYTLRAATHIIYLDISVDDALEMAEQTDV